MNKKVLFKGYIFTHGHGLLTSGYQRVERVREEEAGRWGKEGQK